MIQSLALSSLKIQHSSKLDLIDIYTNSMLILNLSKYINRKYILAGFIIFIAFLIKLYLHHHSITL